MEDCRDSDTSDSEIEIDDDSLPELESVSCNNGMPDIFPNSSEIKTSDIRSAFTYTEFQRHNNIYHNSFFICNNIFVDDENLIRNDMSKVDKVNINYYWLRLIV